MTLSDTENPAADGSVHIIEEDHQAAPPEVSAANPENAGDATENRNTDVAEVETNLDRAISILDAIEASDRSDEAQTVGNNNENDEKDDNPDGVQKGKGKRGRQQKKKKGQDATIDNMNETKTASNNKGKGKRTKGGNGKEGKGKHIEENLGQQSQAKLQKKGSGKSIGKNSKGKDRNILPIPPPNEVTRRNLHTYSSYHRSWPESSAESTTEWCHNARDMKGHANYGSDYDISPRLKRHRSGYESDGLANYRQPHKDDNFETNRSNRIMGQPELKDFTEEIVRSIMKEMQSQAVTTNVQDGERRLNDREISTAVIPQRQNLVMSSNANNKGKWLSRLRVWAVHEPYVTPADSTDFNNIGSMYSESTRNDMHWFMRCRSMKISTLPNGYVIPNEDPVDPGTYEDVASRLRALICISALAQVSKNGKLITETRNKESLIFVEKVKQNQPCHDIVHKFLNHDHRWDSRSTTMLLIGIENLPSRQQAKWFIVETDPMFLHWAPRVLSLLHLNADTFLLNLNENTGYHDKPSVHEAKWENISRYPYPKKFFSGSGSI